MLMKADDQDSNDVENPSSGSPLTVQSRTTASAASLEVILGTWYMIIVVIMMVIRPVH